MARGTVRAAGRWGRLALGALLVAACSGGPNGSAAPPAPTPFAPAGIASIDGANLLTRGARDTASASAEDLQAIGRANAAFALDLFRKLAADDDENLIVGPYSVWSALSMVHAGARGATEAEMTEVLGFDRPQAEVAPLLGALQLALESRNAANAVDLRVANQVFAQPGLPLVEDYLVTLTRHFGAPLAELAFSDPEAAREVVNNWAAERTNDRIGELFPPGTITPSTVMVLANAVSLDAAWTYRFDPAATSAGEFRRADGSKVSVPVMHFGLYLPLAVHDDYQAVELGYGKGELSMVAILPTDMETFVRDATPESLQALFDGIEEQGIHLDLPKFSFSSDIGLDDTLQGLGMRTAFAAGADFSGMVDGGGIWVDTVQHEAFIEVDEAGTEAHAATGVGMAASHGPSIAFDRPFLFVIRDRATGTILFIGRVADPSAE